MSLLDNTKIGNSVEVNIDLSKDRLTKEMALTLHLLRMESIISRKNQLKIFHKVYGTVYCI